MSILDSKLKGNYAGFISRLIAFGIDVAIISIALLLIVWLINNVLMLFGLEQIAVMETLSKILLSGLFALLFSASYYVFFWSLAGQTPGKMLMGLKVISTRGKPISVNQAVRRVLGYVLSIISLWIGFLWILVDNRRQGWHDKIAGTLVVYVWEARAGPYVSEMVSRRQDESGQESRAS